MGLSNAESSTFIKEVLDLSPIPEKPEYKDHRFMSMYLKNSYSKFNASVIPLLMFVVCAFSQDFIMYSVYMLLDPDYFTVEHSLSQPVT
jgi:hypothetical protein